MNREGDPYASLFRQILDQHIGIFHSIARMYATDETAREDLVQEMLLQVWKALPKYDPGRSLSTWLYRIGLNVAISLYRRQKRRKELSSSLEGMDKPEPAPPDPEREAKLAQLQVFISQLKPLDRALMLLYLEERPHREIAEILGISPSNVATRVQRVKEQLKKQFERFND